MNLYMCLLIYKSHYSYTIMINHNITDRMTLNHRYYVDERQRQD